MPTIVQKKFISGDINDTYGKEYKQGTNVKDGTFTKEFEDAQIKSGFLKKATTGTDTKKPTTDTKATTDAKATDAKDAKPTTGTDVKDAKATTATTGTKVDTAKKEEGK